MASVVYPQYPSKSTPLPASPPTPYPPNTAPTFPQSPKFPYLRPPTPGHSIPKSTGIPVDPDSESEQCSTGRGNSGGVRRKVCGVMGSVWRRLVKWRRVLDGRGKKGGLVFRGGGLVGFGRGKMCPRILGCRLEGLPLEMF